ncbi:hypothetical protein [Clostridium sp.]|nr:hypothetical protein [Clostridium sp.]
MVLDFEEFTKEAVSEEQTLDRIADKIIEENIEAFKELNHK